ncbi:MAG: aldehyde dehydrogenase family protein [Kiritimatiellae bacterium]|nr:aldehyde dehydrogenase family protein [Kiritimatiellia bacterium]
MASFTEKQAAYGEGAALTKEFFRAKAVMEKAAFASAVFRQLTQEQVDRIVEGVYKAAFNHRVTLAKMAQEETGMGVWQHKTLQHVFATQILHESIKCEKTVGIISRDDNAGLTEIAEPIGPVLAAVTDINPTASILFTALICLKTRNPLIISPHPRALKACAEAARICYQAALEADAPEDCIQCLDESSRQLDHALMTHPALALILVMGRTDLVETSRSSGTPAILSLPGHVPVLIDVSADIPFAVKSIMASKTFDNGMLLAGEQAIVVESQAADAVIQEFKKQHGHVLPPQDLKKVEARLFNSEDGALQPEARGQSAEKLAIFAGITVPAGTRLLLAPQDQPGKGRPLSGVKLAPLIGLYVRKDLDSAISLCLELNSQGSLGRVAGIYANNDKVVATFAQLLNVGYLMVNTPVATGIAGGVFTRLQPAFILSSSPDGKHVVHESISIRQLLAIKRICRRRCNERWQAISGDNYLDERLSADDVAAIYNRNY